MTENTEIIAEADTAQLVDEAMRGLIQDLRDGRHGGNVKDHADAICRLVMASESLARTAEVRSQPARSADSK